MRLFLSSVQVLLALVWATLSTTFFLGPGLTLARDVLDPDLAGPGIPHRAKAIHQSLSPRIARWASERVAHGAGAEVQLHEVATTEWPLFTAVFYLMATEALQHEWERNPRGPEPAEYAIEAIEASRDLLVDPAHHSWVRWHWGDDYLHQQNVFFRGLLISGLKSYEAITHDGTAVPMLRDQVETLAAEIDRSELGLINDYPLQCYPIDVVASIGWIRRADEVLGTDHSAFVERSRRAFTGEHADANGLVPFRVDLPRGGQAYGPARGIGTAWTTLYAPDLWPDLAPRWYDTFNRLYWQDLGWTAGFREYLPGQEEEWTFEIDAGPVIAGYGTSASAFGIAAARRNGRLDHAWTLTTQLVAASWPLPDGTLLTPRLVSKATDAPFIGEAAILYFLTVQPADGAAIVTGGRTPWSVWVAALVYFGIGGTGPLLLWAAVRRWRRERAASPGGTEVQ